MHFSIQPARAGCGREIYPNTVMVLIDIASSVMLPVRRCASCPACAAPLTTPVNVQARGSTHSGNLFWKFSKVRVGGLSRMGFGLPCVRVRMVMPREGGILK